MRRSTLRVIVRQLLSFTFLLICGFVSAQDQISISGKVTDSKGVPIPAADVTVSTTSGKVANVLTELDGSFKFDELPAGVYQLTIEIVGFLKDVKESVDTAAESSRSLALVLQPIPRPQTPTVPQTAKTQQTRSQSQQPQQTALETQSFQTAEVTALPGLNQFQTDAAQQAVDASAIASRQESTVFVSGNSANLDSGNFNDAGFRNQMMDAARQMGFMIQDFNPMGEGGRGGPGGEMGGGGFGGITGGGPGGGPGGGMGFVGMMGRGGRGAGFRQAPVQGNLSESYSNSALNARTYSLTGQTLNKPVQINNNFSLTLGGSLPFFKTQTQTQTQNRTSGQRGGGRGFGPMGGRPSWNFSYSGTRNRGAQDILTTVPTDLERAGDFSQSYVQAAVIDPATGERSMTVRPVRLYANPNDVSSQFTQILKIDPIAGQLLKYIPKANLPCQANGLCVNNYALERSLPSTSDQIQFSISGLRIGNGNFGFNYSMRRGNSLSAATFAGLDTNRDTSGQQIGISGTYPVQARLIANWRVSINRNRTESNNAFAYQQDVEGALGITGVSRDPMNWGPPTIGFSNYGGISLAAPTQSQTQTVSISGGLNKIGNKHSIRAGADLSFAQRNSHSDSNGRGTYSFNGYATILFDAAGRQILGTGNDFADFLLGLPYSTSRRYVDPTANPYGNGLYLRNRTWSLYIQDNWRIRSNITFNYGLRYDYTGPTFEKYNRLVTLDTSQDFTAVARAFPDEKGPVSGNQYSRSIVDPDRNNFSPRIGIAWRPGQRSRFTFRAGYGIGYNTGGYGSIVNQLVNQAPFAVSQNIATDRSNPLTLQVGFPVNPALTLLNTFAIDPHYRAAYAQQWNLDVQTQVGRLYALSVVYSGSKGTGLDITRAPAHPSSVSNFMFQTNGGSSIYHGLNVQLQRRYSHGFQVSGSYTLSKNIDDVPQGVAQNDLNLAAERALSSQDQRHNFQLNYNYEIPIGQNRMFFAASSAKLLNFIAGWSFSGNLSAATGTPMTARYTSSNGLGTGAALYNSLRADATGASVSIPKSDRTVLYFFNTAAFAIPSGQYGTAGRNTIIGPGSWQMNLSVRKSFRLDENNRRVDFSWQVQNLLNHPNWGGVSTTINNLNFGQVTSMRQMRSMSMNLRVNF